MKRRTTRSVVIILGLLCGGCASTVELEAQQLAYAGSGAENPCLFGGATPRAVLHCAVVNFGPQGLLTILNDEVRARLAPDADCKAHAEAVRTALAPYRDLEARYIYSCPQQSAAQGVCHVSVLVSDRRGGQHVLDNGAVLRERYPAQVATLAQFAAEVHGRYWVGRPPSAMTLLGLEADSP